jgi:hypothetical protein
MLSVVIMNHYCTKKIPYAMLKEIILACPSFAETLNHNGNVLCIAEIAMVYNWEQMLCLVVEIVCSINSLFGRSGVRCAVTVDLHCTVLLQCNYR